MEIFEECAVINDLLKADDGTEARNRLIRLLDKLDKENQAYDPLINHLIRESGLYPISRTRNCELARPICFRIVQSGHWAGGACNASQ